ncbi:unnamed protein product [Meganyctiphanes norvegica]|uniref:C2H2-type domain-containing protein n=1 Tax=Meganyctiphanes norvegica TaxID=48144 RepID=A0AAV2PR98_MEGNR
MWSLSSSEQQRLTLEQLQQQSGQQYLQELQLLQQYQQQQQQQQLDQSKELLQQQLQHSLLYGAAQLPLYDYGQYGSSSNSSNSSSALSSAAAAQQYKDHNQLLSQYNYLQNPLLQWQYSQDAAAAIATHDQSSDLTHSIPHVQSHSIYDIPGAGHASSSRKSYDVSSANETLKKHIPEAFESLLKDDPEGLSASSSRSTPLSPLLPPLPSPVLLPPVSSLLPSPLFSPQLLLPPPQPLLSSAQQPEISISQTPPPLVSSKSDNLNEFRLWNSYLSNSDVKTTKESSKSTVDYKEKNVQNENVLSKNISYSVPELKDTTVHKVSSESSSKNDNRAYESRNTKIPSQCTESEQSNSVKKNVDNPKKDKATKPPPQQSRLKVRSLGSLLAVGVKEEKNETKNGSIYSFESSKNDERCTPSKINMGSFLSIESVDSDDNDTVPQLKIDSVFSLGSQKSEVNDSVPPLERFSELSVHLSKISNVPNNSTTKQNIGSSLSLDLSNKDDGLLSITKNNSSSLNLDESIRGNREALLHMNGVYQVLQNYKSFDNGKSAQSYPNDLRSDIPTNLTGTGMNESFQMCKIKKEVEEIQESSNVCNTKGIIKSTSNLIESSSLESLHNKNSCKNDKVLNIPPKIKEEPKDTDMTEDNIKENEFASNTENSNFKPSNKSSQQNNDLGMTNESIGENLSLPEELALTQDVVQFSETDKLTESDVLNKSAECIEHSNSTLEFENSKQLSEHTNDIDSTVNGFLLHISKDSNEHVMATSENLENSSILNVASDTLKTQNKSIENEKVNESTENNSSQTELTENNSTPNETAENIKLQDESRKLLKVQNEFVENIKTQNEQAESTDCELSRKINTRSKKTEDLKINNELQEDLKKSTVQSSKDNLPLKSSLITEYTETQAVASHSMPTVQEDVKLEDKKPELTSKSTEDTKETIDKHLTVSSIVKRERKSKLNSTPSNSSKKKQKKTPVKTEIIEEHLEFADPIYDSDSNFPACPKSKKRKNASKNIKKESKVSLSWNGKIKTENKPQDIFEFSEENEGWVPEVNEWVPEVKYKRFQDETSKTTETDLIDIDPNVCDICGLNLKSLRGLLIHRKRHFRLPVADASLIHSLPATELQSSLFPTFLGQRDHRLYHRPKLKNLPKQIKSIPKEVWPVSTITNKNDKESSIPSSVAELSGLTGGQLIMFEYCEEFPPLLSQVGMCSRIKNYWHPICEEDKVPIGLPHGEYVPIGPHFTPFLSAFRKGQVLQSVENNMYRAPIYPHQVMNTDFLVIRTTNGYSIRGLDGLYTVGQQCPMYEVPQPNSKRTLIFNRNFLKMFIYRLFKKSDSQRRLSMKDIKMAFPSAPESFLRKVLKPCAKFHRTGPNSNYWVMKPDFQLPSNQEINNLITPEEYCANYSSSTASYRLQEAGYKTQFFSALEDGDEEDCEAMEDEIKAAPWNTTRSYVTALNGLPCLELSGNADPTGCGEGFSYVFITQNRRRSKAKQLQRTLRKMQHGFKKTDFRKLPLKKAIKILRKNGVSKEKVGCFASLFYL